MLGTHHIGIISSEPHGRRKGASRHLRDGRRRQDAHAIELAAVEQHLAEAQIIRRGRYEAACA
jgi:hypothetical protein